MPKQAAARGWTRGSETASTSRSGLLCTRTAQYYEQYYRVPLFTLFRSPQPTHAVQPPAHPDSDAPTGLPAPAPALRLVSACPVRRSLVLGSCSALRLC